MQGALLLDIVVRKGAAILKLLSREDQPLLIRRDTLLVLDLALDVINGIRALHFQRDGLAGQRLDEDLHTATQTKDQMESALLLDVVIAQGPAILELFAGKDETLLIRRNTLLVLDLRFDVVDRIRRLNLKRDRLSRQGLDEDLHTTTETEDEMESRFLLDVVVGEGTSIFELLSSEDEALLVGRNALFILDLRLHVVDRV